MAALENHSAERIRLSGSATIAGASRRPFIQIIADDLQRIARTAGEAGRRRSQEEIDQSQKAFRERMAERHWCY